MSLDWEQLEILLEEALARPAAQRAAFVARATAGDAALREELTSLLAADAASGGFLGGAEIAERAALGPGQRIGAYELLEEIGRGGTGVVFRARRADEQFEKQVAVKILCASRPLLALRFKLERQILAGLEHPAIARLYDSGITPEGTPYYVMELVLGVPIDRYCDERRLAIRDRVRLVARVCEAVDYSHQRLIVHRDLKPANILVTPEGSPKLLDFGIAKLLAPALDPASTQHTASWLRVLTPHYASPEQILGRPITTASDVYSLGVLLHLLLTAELPHRFDGAELAEVERIVREQEIPLPSGRLDGRGAAARATTALEWKRELMGDLDNILLRALAGNPAQRYGTAALLGQDLERYLAGRPVTARPPDLGYRFGKLLRRHRLAAALILGALGLILGTTITLAVQSAHLREERNAARRERDNARRLADFLQHTLEDAGPREARGRDVSVREVLDRAHDRLDRELAGQPAAQAEVMIAIGRVYARLGLAHRAAPLLDAALAAREEALGGEHPEVAEVLLDIATLATKRGEMGEAERLLRRALAIHERLLPASALAASDVLAQLGMLVRARGRPREAIGLLERAITLREQALGPEDPRIARLLTDLVYVKGSAGDDATTEPSIRRSIAILERDPEANPALLTSNLLGLAGYLFSQGRLAEAEQLYLTAADFERRRQGEASPRLPTLLFNLAETASQRHQAAKAIAYYREALGAARAQVRRGHPLERDLLLALGRTLLDNGDAEAAEGPLAEALAIDRYALPEGHAELAESEGLVARCHAARGRAARGGT